MDRKKIWGVILVLAVIGVGLALFFANNGKSDDKATPAPKASTHATAAAASTPAGSSQASTAAVIRFTSSGFSPATLTVKVGDTVTVKNDSNDTLQFDSDPHPTHTDNPFLNLEQIAPGASKSVTIRKAGTFGYHDHLDASMTGTIVAQ